MTTPTELTYNTIANQTWFELVTRFRRETGNQLRLLRVLMTGLLVPVLLVLLALATQNAALNLENRRYITAFAVDPPPLAVDVLREALINNDRIERITVLPETASVPMSVEIKPKTSLTDKQIETLATVLENSGEFSFVSVNHSLLARNTSAYLKAKKLALVFLLIAMILAASTIMVVVRREILRSNSASINLLRQLGATTTAISKPLIARAALLTTLAIIGTTGLVTVFYKTVKHLVDVSPYSTLMVDVISLPHLALLALVSITAACFAATTTLQSIFLILNQSLKRFTFKFR